MANSASKERLDPARRRMACGIGALAVGPLFHCMPLSAFAQTAGYPSKTIRMLVGYSPGGTADIMARIVAEELRLTLGHNVIVENLPGASGNIAAQNVARAPADGHTLFFGNTAEISINKFLMRDMGFDPDVDFAPVVLVYNITHTIAVSGKSPYKSLSDLLEDARRNPGKVRFASAGLGTPGHLAGETLALKSKTSMVHVPYKGGSQALADVIGGHVDCYYAGLTAAAQYFRSGAIRILAVTAPKRVSVMPEVPTVTEMGIPGFDFPLWGGLFAPMKTPKEIVLLLNREVNKAFQRPDVRARMTAQHSEIVQSTPEQFAAFVKADSDKYREITKNIGLGHR